MEGESPAVAFLENIPPASNNLYPECDNYTGNRAAKETEYVTSGGGQSESLQPGAVFHIGRSTDRLESRGNDEDRCVPSKVFRLACSPDFLYLHHLLARKFDWADALTEPRRILPVS